MIKIVFVCLLLSLTAFSFGQTENSESKLKFGFNAAITYSNLQLTPVNSLYAKDMEASNGPGIRMGILLDYKIAEHFSFSPKTEMSFNNGKVSLPLPGDERDIYNVLPAAIEVASHFNYKLNTGKLEPYFSFGPSFKIPITDENNSMRQISNRSDLALDFGVGLHKACSSFSFAPELRYSYGLMNLSTVNAISRLNFHSISLIFNFKG